MMKTIFTVHIILVSISIHNMECHRSPAFLMEQDADGTVWINGGRNTIIRETYDNFFCSLANTAAENDSKKEVTIPQPIFIQLCVQAAKNCTLNPAPFQELIAKIKGNHIKAEDPMIAITKKDLNHRLLSYIPTGKVNALVNDKKIRMTFIVKTKAVESDNNQLKNEQYPVHYDADSDFPLDERALLFPAHDSGYSSRGKDVILTGEEEVRSNYDFTSDAEHHQRIAAEFQQLIK